jgi:hypothetical protein
MLAKVGKGGIMIIGIYSSFLLITSWFGETAEIVYKFGVYSLI